MKGYTESPSSVEYNNGDDMPVADNFNDFVVSPVGIADVTVVVVPLTSFVAFASISSPLLYSEQLLLIREETGAMNKQCL